MRLLAIVAPLVIYVNQVRKFSVAVEHTNQVLVLPLVYHVLRVIIVQLGLLQQRNVLMARK
jgi:hypothetical protein